jgi:hypothetical protein
VCEVRGWRKSGGEPPGLVVQLVMSDLGESEDIVCCRSMCTSKSGRYLLCSKLGESRVELKTSSESSCRIIQSIVE